MYFPSKFRLQSIHLLKILLSLLHIYARIILLTWTEWPAIDKIWKMKRNRAAALELTISLAKMDATWADSYSSEGDKTISLEKADDDVIKEREGEKSNNTEGGKGGEGAKKEYQYKTPLLIAAREGIVEIVDEILKEHPQAIEHVTKDEENILHVAIRFRQMEIFRRVKKMKAIMECRLASRIDNKGYTILHHVADMGNYDGGTKAGPALQLQEELKWLEVLNLP
jgi:hypothetical protein